MAFKNGVNITGRYININDQIVPICGTCYNRNVAKTQFKVLHPRVGGTKKKRKRKKRKYRRKLKKNKKKGKHEKKINVYTFLL